MSVGSRCPRLESVRRGKPLQPTPAGDGLRPAGAREGEHPPAVERGAASLSSPQYSKCRSNYVIWSLVSIKKRARQLKTCFNYRVLLSLPLEGKGDRFAVDEVKMHTRSPSRSVMSRCANRAELESVALDTRSHAHFKRR